MQVLRLNRPEARNALNPELLNAIGRGMLEAEEDPEVRAVVLTGTGERAFCAGMDLRSFSESGSVGLGGDASGMSGFLRFTQGEIGVPIVGAANATAVAGGFELLLGCDVVVASEAAPSVCPRPSAACSPPGAASSSPPGSPWPWRSSSPSRVTPSMPDAPTRWG